MVGDRCRKRKLLNLSLSISYLRSANWKTGMWEPLPLIVYGYAVHPLTPSRRDTRWSSRNNRLSIVTENSVEDHYVHRDVVSLEVGDEVYAFEKYVPRGNEVDGVWYRGYVNID